MDEIIERELGIDFSYASGRNYWKNILGSYYNKAMSKSDDLEDTYDYIGFNNPSDIIVLYGPNGSGKKTLALSFFGQMEQYGYQFITVNLNNENQEKVLEDVYYEYARLKDCCIFIRNFEKIRDKSLLTQFDDSEYNVIIVGIVSKINNVDSEIRRLSNFASYHINLPNYEERVSYFNDSLEEIIYSPDSKAVEYLASHTEGANYLVLNSLMMQINRILKRYLESNNLKSFDLLNNKLQSICESVIQHNTPIYENTDNDTNLDTHFDDLVEAINNIKITTVAGNIQTSSNVVTNNTTNQQQPNNNEAYPDSKDMAKMKTKEILEMQELKV